MGCLSCAGSSTNCTSCGLSVGGQILYQFGAECLASCPKGYWGNGTDNKCYECSGGCSVCTGSGLSSCQECTNASSTIYYKYLYEDICNTSCPDGQYISSSIPFFCQKCSPLCITCSSAADNCTSDNCSANFYYFNNSCLAQCPDNYFPDINSRLCTQCADGCQSCFASGLDSCSKCKQISNGTKYYHQIDNSTCGTSCNLGEYRDDSTLECKVCSPVCGECTSGDVCQSCLSINGMRYFLLGTNCTAICPIGHYG